MNNYLKITYPNINSNLYPKQLSAYIFAKYLAPDKSLLDFGSGTRDYLMAFESLGLHVWGVDKYSYNGRKVLKCDIDKQAIPFNDNFFDYIFTKSVIEHINNPEHMFKELYRVLKPNGTIIILTPDWESRYKDFYEDFSHVRPYTRKALQDVLEIFNFKKVEVTKFYQLPLLWKQPYLTFIAKLLALLPDKLKWKDKRQKLYRKWIRFSKEKMLLGVAIK